MVAECLLFVLLYSLALADPQCYAPSPNWGPINVLDCVDVFEQVLNEPVAMFPLPLTLQQELFQFPYVRASKTCKLQIDLLNEVPDESFTLRSATNNATSIARMYQSGTFLIFPVFH